jgi:hypothetical protein
MVKYSKLYWVQREMGSGGMNPSVERQAYVDRQAVDLDELFETGVNAMLQSLDPYTTYEDAAQAEELSTRTLGRSACGGRALVDVRSWVCARGCALAGVRSRVCARGCALVGVRSRVCARAARPWCALSVVSGVRRCVVSACARLVRRAAVGDSPGGAC